MHTKGNSVCILGSKILTIAIHLLLFLYSIYNNYSSNNAHLIYTIDLSITILLIYISLYDIEYMAISNIALAIGTTMLLAFLIINLSNLSDKQIIDHLTASIALLTIAGLISLTTKKITQLTLLGYGDVKLFALGGALLGTEKAYAAFAIAFITAALFSFSARIANKLKPWQPFPFAPFICIAIQSVWILGKEFWIVQLFVR